MHRDLAQEAINAALTGDWKKAIELNKLLLEKDPKDVDALNRLARSYAETGKITKARSLAEKVIKIDSFNTIAAKSLQKWKTLKIKNNGVFTTGTSSAQFFLEEPGKTKIAALVHAGDSSQLATLDSGDEVHLNNHGHRASITTPDGKYVGRLPDDLSSRLRKLLSYGNKYRVFIKSIDKKEVKVFIREIYRSPKQGDIPSFSSEKLDYVSFTPPELVHSKQEAVNDQTLDDAE